MSASVFPLETIMPNIYLRTYIPVTLHPYSLQQSFGVKYHYSCFTKRQTENSGRLSSLSKTTQLVNQDIRIKLRPDYTAPVLLIT